MSDLKLILNKDIVVQLSNDAAAKGGATIIDLTYDWVLMHAEIERLKELRRWKSCVSEKPAEYGFYIVRTYLLDGVAHCVGKMEFAEKGWLFNALQSLQPEKYEWMEIPE